MLAKLVLSKVQKANPLIYAVKALRANLIKWEILFVKNSSKHDKKMKRTKDPRGPKM